MELLLAIWKYLLLISPYLLLGFMVAGLIHSYITVERIKNTLGKKNITSIFKAAILGIPLPLCSCSVVPTAVTIKKAGANNGATSSFLIATPESGVDSIMVTYSLMDLPMAIFRPLAAFFSAITAGILQHFFNHFEAPEEPPSCCCHHSTSSSVPTSKLKEAFFYSFGRLINDMAGWLLIGILLGGIIEYFIPANIFAHYDGLIGRLIILAIGIPFYICASASTPIAAALVLKGLSPGMALLLLLVGPATNISNLLVLQKYLGKKGVLINVISIAFVALLFSYAVDYLYLHFNWGTNFKVIAHSTHHATWYQIISAIILLILLLKGIWKFKKSEA